MQSERSKKLKLILLFVLILLAFSTGFISGNFLGFSLTSIADSLQRGIDKDRQKPLDQAWRIIHDQFIDQPVDDVELIQGAIRGMMESLGDPYSAYMTPEEFQSLNAPINGEYSGIGAYVDTSGEFLIIISPMPGSPAKLAGLKPGDKVVAIDGEDMTKIKPSLVLERIYGPEGTFVQISVQRENSGEILNFRIERATINLPSVESEMLDGNIGLIRLYTFGDESTKEFILAYNDLLKQKPMSLIIDLRNNSGGLVETSIEITSLFIPDDIVMIEERADGSRKEYRSTGDPLNTEIPLVVLINEGSASASEITAGALQDLGRARLVGMPTFGKGYIQNWVSLRDNSGGLRITTARWLTPKGRQIQGLGLQPDFRIQFTEEDFENKFDAQLDLARIILSRYVGSGLN